MSKIKALLINANELIYKESLAGALALTYKTVEIEGAPNYSKQLQDMYDLIGCRTVEHFALKVEDDCVVDLWFDEEGKLDSIKERQFSVPLITNGYMNLDIIRGNCIVTKSNAEGDIASVTDEDIKHVLTYLNATYMFIMVDCELTKVE